MSSLPWKIPLPIALPTESKAALKNQNLTNGHSFTGSGLGKMLSLAPLYPQNDTVTAVQTSTGLFLSDEELQAFLAAGVWNS